MRISFPLAVATLSSRDSRAACTLAGLAAGGLLLVLALFTLAQADGPASHGGETTYVALLQEETPAEAETAPAGPTPQELRADLESRVADLAARLAAGRDEEFHEDLEALILESQLQIAAATAEISQAVTAANYENRDILEQAELNSAFAERYFDSAIGRMPIPHIISINFPASEGHAPNSSLMPAEHWNIAPRGGAANKFALVDDRGQQTEAELAFESQGGSETTPLKGGILSDQAMMNGGIRAWYAAHRQLHGPPVTVRIENLSLAMQRGYQVYVYVGVGLGLEPGGPAPFQITIGEETPLLGGRVQHFYDGQWRRIDTHNSTGNYFVTPLLAQDELQIEMAPVGFYPGIEMGTTSINGIQLVGTRPRTVEAEEEQLARAAAAARLAQRQLMQASQQLISSPPPSDVAAEIAADPGLRLSHLAKWQVRVADQIEGLRRGDYGAVVTAMQQALAEVPATL